MKISMWNDGHLGEASLDELKTSFSRPTWISVADPTTEDLGKIADILEVPRHVLIGKLRSNYPHADSYFEYTKIFTWHSRTNSGGDSYKPKRIFSYILLSLLFMCTSRAPPTHAQQANGGCL